jgi:hypothetical protein
MQQIDDLAGEPLEFVVEIVGEKIDPLVRALDPAAHFGEMFRLFVAQLVELGPELAQQFFEFLFQRRPPLEMVDDLEKHEQNRRQRRRVDQPRREMLGIGRGDFLRQDRHEQQGRRIAVKINHGWFRSGGASGCDGAGGVAKDFTALGGKVGSAGPGVETEEGESVEVGGDGVKLVTLGVGKVDKDAVLQAGKAQIDRLKAASQEIIFKVLDIVGGCEGGGVETPCLGLVKEIVDEMDELAAGFGNFSDHINFVFSDFTSPISPIPLQSRRAGALGDVSVEKKRPGFPVAHFPARRPQFSSIARLGTRTGEGIGRVVMLLVRDQENASDRSARSR